jgi:hypothetical protein
MRRILRWGVAVICSVCGALSAPVGDSAIKIFDIPAGDALVTLKRFTSQSGAQVLYSVDEVEGVQTRAIRGRFTARDALDRLLAGTKLSVAQDENTGVLIIRPKLFVPSGNYR